jgi:DNA polymerase III gamma/tau subunit
MELYKKYRPKAMEDLIGQPMVVKQVAAWQKVSDFPQFILLAGPSGVGKTTTGRILRTLLQCGEHDYVEMNAASERGIDMVRELDRKMRLKPLGGPVRVYLVDEAHRLTAEAQDALLKILEDTPKHVNFMFSSSEPNKLKKAVLNRAATLTFHPVSQKDLLVLCQQVMKAEGVAKSKDLVDLLEDMVVEANGSPRKLLVMLDAVLGHDNIEDQRQAYQSIVDSVDAFALVKVICKPGVTWQAMRKQLQACDESVRANAEGIRHQVLGYATACLLSNPKAEDQKFYATVILRFSDNLYDAGRAGFVQRCWRIANNV